MDSEACLIWNVRGLKARARHQMVRTVVDQHRVSLVCLQETKRSVIDDTLIRELLGASFDYHYLSAQNTCGGILVAWRTNIWAGSHFSQQGHSVTLKLTLLVDGFTTWLTTVYGPQRDLAKTHFLDELCATRQHRLGSWLLCGDFNMICNAVDKNNNNLH